MTPDARQVEQTGVRDECPCHAACPHLAVRDVLIIALIDRLVTASARSAGPAPARAGVLGRGLGARESVIDDYRINGPVIETRQKSTR
jgi:hypothetical protein